MFRLELRCSPRWLAWESSPGSVHKGVGAVIAGGDCLCLSPGTAELFSSEGNLKINVTVGLKYN